MTRNEKIRLVLVEDEPILLTQIAADIQRVDSDFTVVGKAENGVEALAEIEKQLPDALITDLKMPVMSGMELIRRVKNMYPSIKIIILSGYADFALAQQAIRYGVSGYLLKPSDDRALEDTLKALKSSLLEKGQRPEKVTVYSENYREYNDRTLLYLPIAVCLGNLFNDPGDARSMELYKRRTLLLRWPAVLDALLPGQLDWAVSDQDKPNQKTVVCRLSTAGRFNPPSAAGELRLRLMQQLSELPVSVCVSGPLYSLEEAQLCGRQMEKFLQTHIIPAQGSVFVLGQIETERHAMLNALMLHIEGRLKQALKSDKGQSVESELRYVTEYLIHKDVPQADMQRMLIYLLRVLEYAKDAAQPENQAELLRIFTCATDKAQLSEDLLDMLLRIAFPQRENASLPDRMREHMDRYYLQIGRMQELTETFHYEYDYLARVFKKSTGTTISRYVTDKKLEFAKRLLESRETISVAQISKMAGFSDLRNFLRLFKAYTGQTPRQYRKEADVSDSGRSEA